MQEFTLNVPVMFAKEEISTLTIARPTGKDLRQMTGQTMNDMVTLLGKCSGMPPSFIDMMDGADVLAACEVLADFLANGRKTGETS